MDYIMTSEELARECLDIAVSKKTIYMYACYGFQVTDRTIKGKAEQNLNGWYTSRNISKLQRVANETPPTWGFDCVNLIKGILWGWTGDVSKEKGGAKYAANGVPDTNADGMIQRCLDVSEDFEGIMTGEALWIKGHIGVYIGGGLAVECTPAWEDGVQVTCVRNIADKAGYNGRTWTKHGRLPWINYGIVEREEDPVYALGHRTLKRGCLGDDVRELQDALIRLGYDCGAAGADGDFGKGTLAAVMAFQDAAGLETDGIFGRLSLEALRKTLAGMDEEDAGAAPVYDALVRGLSEAQLNGLRTIYGADHDIEVTVR